MLKSVKNWPEPVSEGHHDVQWGEEEDKMKEEVAVGHTVTFIMDHFLASFAFVVNYNLFLH